MPRKRIAFLLKKKLSNTASDAEISELSELFLHLNDDELSAVLKPIWDEYEVNLSMPAEQSDELLVKILQIQKESQPAIYIPYQKRSWFKYAVAAIFIFVMASVAYLFYFNDAKVKPGIVKYRGDIAPGMDGAKLKLSDGRTIMIDSMKDGLVAVENKVKIYKQQGKIIYEGSGDGSIYNEIITDRGRQWSAVLPDGTTAWLNASSSLRYPLKFSAKERLVEMKGEAAFKVQHNALQPFRVKVGSQLIEDIGTEFNVKAYNDESSIQTTLIEGSASITTRLKKVIIKAGELSTIDNQTQINIVSAADIEIATAWRRGLFSFKDANIQTVMKDISRWYNVEVKYEGNVSESPDFTGKMGRSLSLVQTMKILSIMRVHFRIEEDKRIVIMP